MIAIVDYCVGNLFSLRSSLEALGLAAEVTGEADRLRSADRIILPGVGAFADAKAKLDATGLVPVLREEAARKMLCRVGLSHRLDHFPRQMSGGQQQRAGIARAFIARPDVVFADEPTGNLDSKTTVEIMEMICAFSRKFHQTIILVTHDPEMAAYADRIVRLIDGEIVSDETRRS